MKNFRRSKKALSPVVASIILIAVTVAVSIAVAVWMGALTTGFMQTEQVTFGTPSFAAGTMTVVVKNTGTSSVVLQSVYLNGAAPTSALFGAAPGVAAPYTLPANSQVTLVVSSTSIVNAGNYEVKVITAKNNPFAISAIASY